MPKTGKRKKILLKVVPSSSATIAGVRAQGPLNDYEMPKGILQGPEGETQKDGGKHQRKKTTLQKHKEKDKKKRRQRIDKKKDSESTC